MDKDLAARVVELKAEVAKAQQLRAASEANLTVAKQRLKEVDEKLKALGITPENCDVELAALETQLEQTVADLSAKVAAEVAAYTTILTAIQKAFQ